MQLVGALQTSKKYRFSASRCSTNEKKSNICTLTGGIGCFKYLIIKVGVVFPGLERHVRMASGPPANKP